MILAEIKYQLGRILYFWCRLMHHKHWHRASELDGLDYVSYYGWNCHKCDRDHLTRNDS